MATDFDEARRRTVQGLGLMALASGLSSHVMADTSLAPHSANPLAPDAFQRFLRMRTSSDGSPVLWVYSGVLVVKPEGEVAQPVARIEGLSRSQATKQVDDRWLWELDEAGYFCDPVSGDVAQKVFNPFTTTWVQPRHYRSPQKLILSPNRIDPGVSLPDGVDFRGEITELARIAGTVAMTEDLYVKMSGAPATEGNPARPPRFAASLATFSTRESQFERPQTEWIDCQFNYTTLNSFVGWLGMSGAAGVQDMRLVGVKIRIDDQASISDRLRERILSEHQDLLT